MSAAGAPESAASIASAMEFCDKTREQIWDDMLYQMKLIDSTVPSSAEEEEALAAAKKVINAHEQATLAGLHAREACADVVDAKKEVDECLQSARAAAVAAQKARQRLADAESQLTRLEERFKLLQLDAKLRRVDVREERANLFYVTNGKPGPAGIQPTPDEAILARTERASRARAAASGSSGGT